MSKPTFERFDLHGRMVTRVFGIKSPTKNYRGEAIGPIECHDCTRPATHIVIEDDGLVWASDGCDPGG